MILYIIYAIAYLFVGALLDRIMNGDGEKGDVLSVVLWPLYLVLALLLWGADEIVKYFRGARKKTKSLPNTEEIVIKAREYADMFPVYMADTPSTLLQRGFDAGAHWAISQINSTEQTPKP